MNTVDRRRHPRTLEEITRTSRRRRAWRDDEPGVNVVCATCGHFEWRHWPRCCVIIVCGDVDYHCTCREFRSLAEALAP